MTKLLLTNSTQIVQAQFQNNVEKNKILLDFFLLLYDKLIPTPPPSLSPCYLDPGYSKKVLISVYTNADSEFECISKTLKKVVGIPLVGLRNARWSRKIWLMS